MKKLTFTFGTINSGKTNILKENLKKNENRTLVLNSYFIDNNEIKYDYLIKEEDNLYELIKNSFSKYDDIYINNAHLLTKKQIDELMFIVIRLNKNVYCYGLRVDFQNKGFTGSKRLFEIAHELTSIESKCSCGNIATCNIRKVNGKYEFSGDVIKRNSDEIKYEAMCTQCYYDKVFKYLKFKKDTMH